MSSVKRTNNNELTSVQVAVRIRPTTEHDNQSIPTRWQKTVVHPSSSNSISIDNSIAGNQSNNFIFDRVHGPLDSQDIIYENNVQNLVNKFIDGYNVTILAYGQTSSGKSYTSMFLKCF